MAYFFLACQKKVCKKETPESGIALARRKDRLILRSISRSASVKERPLGGAQDSRCTELQCGEYFCRLNRNVLRISKIPQRWL